MKVDPMKIERYGFPVNLSQFKNLEGKMLTHVEAMNLPAAAEKANKDLVRQTLWKWFEGVQENSLTSYRNCWAPIYSFTDNGVIREDGGPQTNRWGYLCPNGCKDGQECDACPDTRKYK